MRRTELLRRSGLVAPLLIIVLACAEETASDDVVPETAAAPAAEAPNSNSTTTTTSTTKTGDVADQQPPDPPPSSGPVVTGSTSTVNTSPPTSVVPLYEAGDIDAGLQPFIVQATDDLAARLEVNPVSISTHAAAIVIWPDSSLGCPQPGMSYAQVSTDGSIIELEHDGAIYRYHTGGQSGPFICDQALDKTPPTNDLDLDADSADY